MEDSRTSDNQTYTRPARQISIYTCSITGSLLIPETDELDPEVDGLFRDFYHRYADNAEDDSDPKATQSARNDLGAGWGRHGGI